MAIRKIEHPTLLFGLNDNSLLFRVWLTEGDPVIQFEDGSQTYSLSLIDLYEIVDWVKTQKIPV